VTLRYLLDTSIVSLPIAKSPSATVIEKLAANGNHCAIAAPVWHELQYGCERMPTGKRRAAINAYLSEVVRTSFPILPYDEAAALRHATERARLESAGRPVPFVDGQIAAIAMVNNLTLVTRNVRHFERFRSLNVEDWTVR